MICRKCGEILDENVKFCTACGAAQVSNIAASKLNSTHVGDADCAHDEVPRRRRRTGRLRNFLGRALRTLMIVLAFIVLYSIVSRYVGELVAIMLVPMLLPTIIAAMR